MFTNRFLIFGALFFIISIAHTQNSSKVAFLDMEYILENLDEYQKAIDQLNQKVERWKKDIDRQKIVIEQKQKNLALEKVLLTKELIEERQSEIQYLQEVMFKYQQDRFGPKGDYVIQQGILVQPVQDRVFSAVSQIAKSNNYDVVFDKSSDIGVIYAKKHLDISDLVLKLIRQSLKINQPNKKQ